MLDSHNRVLGIHTLGQRWPRRSRLPAPGVAKPQRGQQVQLRRLRTAIRRRDADEDVVWRGFGVFDNHIEVAVIVEDARVHQFEFRVGLAASPVLLDKTRVRELSLRILVEELHVRVRRRAVEVEVVFLYILAMIPLVARQPEQPLLKNRVAAIPKRECETQVLMAVADAGDSVFIPPISFGARMIVRQVLPRCTVRAVVFTHGAPGTIADVGAPALPVGGALVGWVEALFFGIYFTSPVAALGPLRG